MPLIKLKPPLSRRELERPMCVDFCRNGGGHTANHLIDQHVTGIGHWNSLSAMEHQSGRSAVLSPLYVGHHVMLR
jgi:hypothetical protein